MSGTAGGPDTPATPGWPPSSGSAAPGLRPSAPPPSAPLAGWPPASDSAGPSVALTPARARAAVRAFLRSPIEGASWRATLAILLGFFVAVVAISVLSALFSTGGSLLIWLVGIPIVALGIEASRLVAREERWRVGWVDRRPLVAHPYRPYDGLPRRPYGPWVRAWAESQFLDANRWRDVVYVLVLFPLAIIELVVSLVLWAGSIALLVTPLIVAGLNASGMFERLSTRADLTGAAFVLTVPAFLLGLFLVPVAASSARGLMALHRAVVQGLLCVDPTVALRQDVERLRGSRSAALELEASELRRIERDLHDGAQQRLVMLSIDLGLAEDRLVSDPDSARQLVADAREQARLALAEIRDLVRGTAPSILVDRGLVAALGAVAGNCPVPTTVDSALAQGERLPPAVERAAYFVVAESLANVAKHSGATQAAVTVRRERGARAGGAAASAAGAGAGAAGGGGAGDVAPGAAGAGARAGAALGSVAGAGAGDVAPDAASSVGGVRAGIPTPGASGSAGVASGQPSAAFPATAGSSAAPGAPAGSAATSAGAAVSAGDATRISWPAAAPGSGPDAVAVWPAVGDARAPGAPVSTGILPGSTLAPAAGPASAPAPMSSPIWPTSSVSTPSWSSGPGDRLVVEVRDDGSGGATIQPGGGLAGLRDRAEALDGVLVLMSPPGGPTLVHVEIPISAG